MRALVIAAYLLRLVCTGGSVEYLNIPGWTDWPENYTDAGMTDVDNNPYEILPGKCIQMKQVVTNFLPKNYDGYVAQMLPKWRLRGRKNTSISAERCCSDIVEVVILLVSQYRREYFHVDVYDGYERRRKNVQKRTFFATATMMVKAPYSEHIRNDLYNASAGVVEIGMDLKPHSFGIYYLWHMRYTSKNLSLIKHAADPVDFEKGACIFLEDVLEKPRFRCYVDTQGNVVYLFHDRGMGCAPTRILTIYHRSNVNESDILPLMEEKRKDLMARQMQRQQGSNAFDVWANATGPSEWHSNVIEEWSGA